MYKKQIKQDKNEVVQAFMNHCATIIQANIRGYQQRKYYKKFLPLYRRFKKLLYAGFIGWKTRKILKLSLVKNKINEIHSLKTQQKKLQMRIAKRDFTDEFVRLLKNGLWLYYFLKEKKVPLAQKTLGFQNKNQGVAIKKIDLKQAFNIIPKGNFKKVNSKNENNIVKQKKFVEQIRLNDISSVIDFESQKSKENKIKKCVNPPKPINIKAQKPQERQMKIETEIELEMKESQNTSPKTPNYSSNQLKQFKFYTKPRDPLPTRKKFTELNKEDLEYPFKHIQMNTHSQRKGLNMTLSKKSVEQKLHDSTPINLQVLHDFTKKKNQFNFQVQDPSLEIEDFSIFSTKDDFKNTQAPPEQKDEPLQSRRTREFQMKKVEFQKRKIQFEKKSKQFKKMALK